MTLKVKKNGLISEIVKKQQGLIFNWTCAANAGDLVSDLRIVRLILPFIVIKPKKNRDKLKTMRTNWGMAFVILHLGCQNFSDN